MFEKTLAGYDMNLDLAKTVAENRDESEVIASFDSLAHMHCISQTP